MAVVTIHSDFGAQENKINHYFHFFPIYLPWSDGTCGEGNGKWRQYSCLENPVDRGAWWAAVHSISKTWTRLKRLSSSNNMEHLELKHTGHMNWTDGAFGLQNHCKWWLQPWNQKMLVPWKKSYDQPRQHIKGRDITLPTKVHLVKAMVFPVVMYGCENWIIKKLSAEELMLLICDVGEVAWESLGLQGDPTSPS